MKHFRLLLISLAASALITPVVAQDSLTPASAMQQVVPADTAIRRGTLANGMTYIVRRATGSKGMAEFRLVQRTGSLVEEDDERGMAHLLEHILFRGTKHFPGTSVLDFLRRNGVAFGPDVNAATGFENTIYKLANVPVIREGLADSCLLVLRDWSADATLSSEALEAERPIVIEEWRGRSDYRSSTATMSDIYGQCRYCERPPIGDTAVVRSCTIGQIHNFYHKWYQPQNQCVIAVGDFEADAMVARIRSLFGDLERGQTRVPEYDLPHVTDDGPHISILQDKVLPYAALRMEWIVPEVPLAEMNRLQYFVDKRCYELVERTVRDRMKRLSEVEADILRIEADWSPFLASSRAHEFSLVAVVSADGWQSSFRTIMTEVERLRRHGISERELKDGLGTRPHHVNPYAADDSLRIDWTPPKEKNPDDINLRLAVENCVEHYLKGTIGIAPWSYNVIRRFCSDHTTREVVGQCLARIFASRDHFITLQLSDGAGALPSRDDVCAMMDDVRRRDDIAAEETAGGSGALATNHTTNPHRAAITPTAGRIVSRMTLADTSRTEFRLSNGVRVIWVNRLAQNNVDMRAFLPGGYSQLAYDEINYAACPDWIKRVKQVDKVKLEREETRFNLGRLYWYDDADSVFMEIYSRLARPEIDTVAFNKSLADVRLAAPLLKMPRYEAMMRGKLFMMPDAGVDSALRVMADAPATMNIGHLQQVIDRLHGNYNGLTVVMQGCWDEKKCMRLIETYLASLPSRDEPFVWRERPEDHQKDYDDLDSIRVKGNGGVPIAEVFMHVNQERGLTYSASQAIHHKALADAMRQVLINTIRLQHNDIYFISVDAENVRHPFAQQNYTIHFTCPPDEAMRIVADVRASLHAMATGDAISPSVIESFVNLGIKRAKKDHTPSADDVLEEYIHDGQWADPNNLDLLRSVTPVSLRAYTKALLDQGHIQTYIIRVE